MNILFVLYLISVVLALAATSYVVAQDYYDDHSDSSEFYQLTFGNLISRLLLCFIPLANLRPANDALEAGLDWIEEQFNTPVVRHKRGS